MGCTTAAPIPYWSCLRSSATRLGQPPPQGDEPASAAERGLELIDQAFRGAVSRGLAHLDAEDQRLGGRIVTLHGRRLVNFSSCSYLGLETDLRLKNAACAAIERYGVQFSSSRAYISAPP